MRMEGIYSTCFNSFCPEVGLAGPSHHQYIYTTAHSVTCQMSLTFIFTEDLKNSRGMNDLQVSWVGSLTRQNSLSSSNCQPTPSQHQQLTPQNSLSSYHSSVYNGGRGGHSSSLQYDDNSKPINNLTARGTLSITDVSHSRNMESYLARLAWYLGFSYEWKFSV